MEHNVYIYILVMGAATYLVRAVPLIFIRHELKNTIIRSFLYYVPYVTLAVMTFPSSWKLPKSCIGPGGPDYRNPCGAGRGRTLKGVGCLLHCGLYK